MSFIIRQIAKRADGGDIIRTRTLATPEISVGRGTDCDIQLADLGIMLRHARLIQLSTGLVAVEATGGVPLEIDGRFVSRADVNVSERPAINMASHRLTLEPGETDGDVLVTAERVIAATDAADAESESEIFSLKGAMPARRTMAWGLAVVILLFGLLLPVFTMMGRGPAELPDAMVAEAGRLQPDAGKRSLSLPTADPQPLTSMQPDIIWTSGTMSGAHAGLTYDCGACHQKAFVATQDQACTACHKPNVLPDHAAADRMAKGRFIATGGFKGLEAGIHAATGLEPGRCASCHKEHEGKDGALMVSASFCTDCHTGLDGRLQDTAIANVETWERHPEFKPTLVVQPSLTQPRFERVSLDSRPQEISGLIYPHDLHMSRTNAVANMVKAQGLPAKDGALGCNYCHVADSDGQRFKPIEMEANCSACHDLAFARDGNVLRTLPHGKPAQVAGIIRDFYLGQALRPRADVLALQRRTPGAGTTAELKTLAFTNVAEARARGDAAIETIFTEKGLCADCHKLSSNGAANAAERWDVAPISLNDHYLPKGRFPHNQHDSYNGKTGDAACTACHKGVAQSKRATDVLLPNVSQCRDCHGSTNVKTNVAASCDTCHGYHFGTDGPAPTAVTGLKVAGDAAGHGAAAAWHGPDRAAAARARPAARAGLGG